MIPHSPYPRRSFQDRPVAASLPDTRVPDLQTQLEALFDSVWRSEADWAFNDRLDMALKRRA